MRKHKLAETPTRHHSHIAFQTAPRRRRPYHGGCTCFRTHLRASEPYPVSVEGVLSLSIRVITHSFLSAGNQSECRPSDDEVKGKVSLFTDVGKK